MDDKTSAQVRTIHQVVNTLHAADSPTWLFGGWGLDSRAGRITRDHGDIEFWVERRNAVRSRDNLIQAGASALSTQPPEESCEFIWANVQFSTAYFHRQPDGTFTTMGSQSDWVFPAGSFGDEPGLLEGVEVPSMSVAGMLAMKEQFPTLRNGRPWRPKDVADIAVLRALASG